MTVAEQLARKMAERKKSELNTLRETALAKLKTFEPTKAPKYVHTLAKKLKEARDLVKVFEGTLRGHGYEIEEDGELKRYSKSRGWGEKSPEELEIYQTCDARMARMWKLSEKVNIDLHGLKPLQAKPILEKFMKDLEGL